MVQSWYRGDEHLPQLVLPPVAEQVNVLAVSPPHATAWPWAAPGQALHGRMSWGSGPGCSPRWGAEMSSPSLWEISIPPNSRV